MGKGDKRTRRGKLFNRSYGKSRLQEKGRTEQKHEVNKKKSSK